MADFGAIFVSLADRLISGLMELATVETCRKIWCVLAPRSVQPATSHHKPPTMELYATNAFFYAVCAAAVVMVAMPFAVIGEQVFGGLRGGKAE